jgi:hypothetical protein
MLLPAVGALVVADAAVTTRLALNDLQGREHLTQGALPAMGIGLAAGALAGVVANRFVPAAMRGAGAGMIGKGAVIAGAIGAAYWALPHYGETEPGGIGVWTGHGRTETRGTWVLRGVTGGGMGGAAVGAGFGVLFLADKVARAAR